MYKKGLVSIVVPCYNGEKYIDRLIKSVLNQTYDKIQLILVNDGSTDDSEKIILNNIREFNENGKKLTYVKKNNGGLGSAINFGLKHIEGEYFTWLGVDDWFYPTCIERYVELFNINTKIDVVRANGHIVNEETGEVLYDIDCNIVDKHKENLFEDLLYENDFHFGPSMLKTSVFEYENGGMDIYESREGQNWQLLIPVFYSRKCGYIEDALYGIAYREDSISRRANYYKERITQLEEYINIIITTVKNNNKILEKEKNYIVMKTYKRYFCQILKIGVDNLDYQVVCEFYKRLKKNGWVSDYEHKVYRNRYKHIEYWMYLKSKILKLFQGK